MCNILPGAGGGGGGEGGRRGEGKNLGGGGGVLRTERLAVFILEDALSVWTNLGKHLLFVWLFVSSIKTGTRRIIRLDELSSITRLERRRTENGLSRRIMRPLPVFILETNNQTNNKCLPKFVQTDNASSSIKTAIEGTVDSRSLEPNFP